MALGAFVLAEAIIFVPMLFIAMHYVPGAINNAAMVTLLGFVALTAVAFVSGLRVPAPIPGRSAIAAVVRLP